MNHKILLTSRIDKDKWEYPAINIKHISDLEEQKTLFEKYRGRCLKDDESADFELISNLVNAHTLTLALIAVQCKESAMTLKEIRMQLESDGVYTEDPTVFSYKGSKEEQNMYGHIRKLWNMAQLTSDEKQILKALMLIPVTGIPKREFETWMHLGNLNTVNSLIHKSWIHTPDEDDDTSVIALHAVIAEVIYRELYTQETTDLSNYKSMIKTSFQNRSETCAEHLRYLSYGEHMVRFLKPEEKDINILLALSMEQEHVYNLTAAEQTLDKAKEFLLAIDGMQSLQAGHLYNNYGVVYHTMRDYQRSIDAYLLGKKLYSENGESALMHYGYLLHNLARVYQCIGKHEHVLALEKEAEQILKQHWPYHWGEIYDVRANHCAHEIEKLQVNLKKAYKARHYGKIQQLKIRIQNKRRQESQYWQTALNLKKQYKADESQQMITLSKLACTKAFLKQKSAIEDIQQVYDFHVRTKPENSSYIGVTYSKMCLIYEQLGDRSAAVKYGEMAVHILESTLGKNSPEYQTALHNLQIAK